MLLSQILSPVKYDGKIQNDCDISDIVYDSRKSKDCTIFVCICGYNSDGHEYAQKAYENGSRVFICEKDISLPDDAQIFKVENSRKVLGLISEEFFCHPANELKIIGITGTKGKTTVAHIVQKILNGCGVPCGIIGTVGAEFMGERFPTENTTPESYELQKLFRLMLDKGCKAVALEVSSLGIKQGRVDRIQFAAGVFTNLSPDHIGKNEHESFSEYAYFKSLLFRHCDIAVINHDDEAYGIMEKDCKCKVISYGFDCKWDIFAYDIGCKQVDKNKYLSFNCSIFNKKYSVQAPLKGEFNVYNILASLGVACSMGCCVETAINSLKDVRVRGRVETVDVDADFDVVIDYAHNGFSLKSIIETLETYKSGRIICVFGSVGGRTFDRRKEMGIVAGSMCDLCVVTSDNPNFEDPMNIIGDIVKNIQEVGGQYYIEPDREKAIEYALSIAKSGDIILLAGKGHEEYQLVKGEKIPFSEIECVKKFIGNGK